jgi:hypothetical protein
MKTRNRNSLVLVLTILLGAAVVLCQTDPPQDVSSALPSDIHRLFSGEVPNLQEIGKRVVAGRLEKIEDTKLTISHPHGVEYSVVVDANTEFLDAHGQAVTLADFKPGEQVAAVGTLKDGVFVATEFGKVPIDLSGV